MQQAEGNEVMAQGVTSGDSSECTRGAPVSRLFMEEQEEAVAAGGWEAAVADTDLLKNCLLHGNTGQGDRNRDWEQIEQRWQRGTRTALVNRGRGDKIHKDSKTGGKERMENLKLKYGSHKNRAMNLKGLS